MGFLLVINAIGCDHNCCNFHPVIFEMSLNVHVEKETFYYKKIVSKRIRLEEDASFFV